MATSAKAQKSAPSKSANDAIKLLINDHKEVKALFKQYDKLVEGESGGEEKQALAEQICTMLTVHATVEEELFYPAAREVLGEDEDLVDEANIEHASAKNLIAQIQSSSPDDEHYDAKVKVLGEYINHHVQEEEGEMFPKVKKEGIDSRTLGIDMAARKDQLMAELRGEAAQT